MAKMSQAEREAFLADLHVGIISIDEPGRGPLTAPIWYDYEPGGELWVVTGPTSRKGRLLESGKRISLCVQTEQPPYKYATVEGPITSIEPSKVEVTRAMAHRYLGKEMGDSYIEQTGVTDGDSVVVRMKPERWLTVDYGKEFAS